MLSVSPMLREMILRLEDGPDSYAPDDHFGRLVRVLLDELALMPKEGLELPRPAIPRSPASPRSQRDRSDREVASLTPLCEGQIAVHRVGGCV